MKNNDDIFIIKGLKEPLSKEETKELFLKYQSGDKNARLKLIEHNLRLVLYVVNTKFSYSDIKSDLVSIGMHGLLKAVDTFDISKNTQSATYLYKCIYNEIIIFLRKESRQPITVSLEDSVYKSNDSKELKNKDILYDEELLYTEEEQVLDHFVQTEQLKAIKKYLDSLPLLEQKIILLNAGLIDGKVYSQRDIGKLLGLSRGRVSQLSLKARKKLLAKIKRDNLPLFQEELTNRSKEKIK